MTHSSDDLKPIARFRALAAGFHVPLLLREMLSLGIFDTLMAGPKTAAELSAGAGASERGIEAMANLAVFHGVLTLQNTKYEFAPGDADLFVKEAGSSAAEVVLDDTIEQLWRDGLHAAVTTGTSPYERVFQRSDDQVRSISLLTSFRFRAERSVIESIDVSGRRNLLSPGGRAADHCAILCRQNPGLGATALDVRPMLDFAAGNAARAGVADRVNLIEGNYRTDPYPDGHDVVLFAGPLHSEPEAMCRQLLSKARAALPAGGLLVIHGVLFSDDKTGSEYGAFITLNQLIRNPQAGRPRAAGEYRTWLAGSGFGSIQIAEHPEFESVIVTAIAE